MLSYEYLRKICKGEIRQHEPLSQHTTFRIGGPADLWIVPASIPELIKLLPVLKEHKIKILPIGNGSNLLVCDKGFHGAIIKLTRACTQLHVSNEKITVGAGVSLKRLLNFCSQNLLTGLEFLVGIPGTVGGAIKLNAGAYGKEISYYLDHIVVIEDNGKRFTIPKEALRFDYRKSNIPNNYIITEAQFVLHSTGDTKSIITRMNDYLSRKKATQPLSLRSAGSVFKNPPNDYAGRLIQLANCKGLKIGAAGVSVKHANFIVNYGGASADDVISLIKKIQQIVYQKTKVRLVPEIEIIGER